MSFDLIAILLVVGFVVVKFGDKILPYLQQAKNKVVDTVESIEKEGTDLHSVLDDLIELRNTKEVASNPEAIAALEQVKAVALKLEVEKV